MRMPQTVTLAPASSTTVTLTSSIPLPSSVAGETLFAHVSLSNGINTDATFQVQAQATATSPTVSTAQEVGVNVFGSLTAGEPGTVNVGLYNSTSSPVVVNTVTVEIFPGQGSAQPLSSGSAGPVTIPPKQIQTVTVSLPTLPTSYYGPAYASVYINGQFEVNIGVTISPPPSQSVSPTSTLQTTSSPTTSSTTSTTSSSTSQTSSSSSQCSPIWWNGLMSTLDEAMAAAQYAKNAFPGCQIAVWVATPSWSGYKPLYAITFSTASQSYVSNTVFGGGAQASLYTVV